MRVELENAIHTPQNGAFEGFEPLNGVQSHHTPKRHLVVRKDAYNVLIVKMDPSVRAGRDPKDKVKRSPIRSRDMPQITCSSRPPTLTQRHMCLCGQWSHSRRSYIFQILSKFVQTFWRHGGSQNVAIPVTFAIGFCNSLYCRTECRTLAPRTLVPLSSPGH